MAEGKLSGASRTFNARLAFLKKFSFKESLIKLKVPFIFLRKPGIKIYVTFLLNEISTRKFCKIVAKTTQNMKFYVIQNDTFHDVPVLL